MANIVSFDALDTFFADFIESIIPEIGSDNILIAYEESGQVSSKIDQDVVYVKTFQEYDEKVDFKNRKRHYDPLGGKCVNSQSTMRIITLELIFYGPKCDEYSSNVNEIFHFDSTNSFLYKNNLALIPAQTEYKNRFYEKVNERWWKRADLKLKFYNSITVEEKSDTINVGIIETTIS